MEQMTVKALLKYCQEQVRKGNGDKIIALSDDNEGNGYHGMFFAFTELTEDEKQWYEGCIYDSEEDLDKLIILG